MSRDLNLQCLLNVFDIVTTTVTFFDEGPQKH